MKYSKYILALIASLLLFSATSYSQYVKIRNNNMYLSAGTSLDFQELGLLYTVSSIAYERNIYFPRKGVWNARGGIGGVALLMEPLGVFYYADLVYVHGIHFHHLEVCFGFSGLYNSQIKKFEWWTNDLEFPFPVSLYAGYRFHLPNGNYIFRAGVGWPEQISMSVGTSF